MRVLQIALCVSDLDRATAFYTTCFGFQAFDGQVLKDAFHELLGMTGPFVLASRFVRRDDLSIELLSFDAGKARDEPPKVGPITRLGMTHITFEVHDVGTVLARVEACGGQVLGSTRTKVTLPGSAADEIIFVTDPDGTRIELVKMVDFTAG